MKVSRKADICKNLSCLEFIVNNLDENFAVDVLEQEPFRILVKNYWNFCRRGFEVQFNFYVLEMFCYFGSKIDDSY